MLSLPLRHTHRVSIHPLELTETESSIQKTYERKAFPHSHSRLEITVISLFWVKDFRGWINPDHFLELPLYTYGQSFPPDSHFDSSYKENEFCGLEIALIMLTLSQRFWLFCILIYLGFVSNHRTLFWGANFPVSLVRQVSYISSNSQTGWEDFIEYSIQIN